MKIINKRTNINMYMPKYISEEHSVCFLDIETTGLSHVHNRIVLIGLHIISKNDSYIIQILSDKGNLKDEILVLKELSKILETVDIIYTYNGSTFDIPFITKKLKIHNIKNRIRDVVHIDLIKQIRSNKLSLNLENYKLKTVEKHLGIYREDSISGAESVELYNEYIKTNSPALEKTILKHNFEDVLYLPKVLKLEDGLRNNSLKSHILNIEIRDSDYSINHINKDYLNNVFLELISIKISELNINLKGNLLNHVTPYQVFGSSFTLNIDPKLKSFEINILANKCKFTDNSYGLFIDLNSDSLLSLSILTNKNNYNLNIPENIMLLSIDNEILIDNIKNLLTEIVKR